MSISVDFREACLKPKNLKYLKKTNAQFYNFLLCSFQIKFFDVSLVRRKLGMINSRQFIYIDLHTHKHSNTQTHTQTIFKHKTYTQQIHTAFIYIHTTLNTPHIYTHKQYLSYKNKRFL